MVTSQSSLHITRATLLIAVFSLLSRFLGLVRDRLLAGTFGAGDVLDVYTAAFRIPDLLYNLLILGTLSAAFIPVYLETVSEDETKARKLAVTVLNATALVMGGLAFALMVLAPVIVPLVVPGFSSEKQMQTVLLTRIMMLSPFFFSVSSVFSSLLNASRRFVLVAALPLLYNGAIILGLLVLYPLMGIFGLGVGVALGAFLHMVVQIPQVWKLGISWNFSLDRHMPQFRRVVRTFLPRVVGMDSSQISFFISSIVGSLLPAGTIAIYSLAFNLQAVPLGVIAVSFATVAFTLLSEAAVSKDWDKFKAVFQSNFSQILFFIVPLATLLLVLRAQIVRLVLGSGQFGWDDTIRTLTALGFFSLSLFSQSLVPLFSRAFYALGNTVTPVYCGLGSAAVNIAAALILGPRLGVSGLALAFSLASIVNFVSLFVSFELKYGNIVDGQLIYKLEKIAAATLLAGIAAYGTLYAADPFVDTARVLGLLLQTLLAAVAGVGVYLATGALMGVEESRHIIKTGRLWLLKLRAGFTRLPGLGV
jgi:putative peptidoglycan lipid II flippase